MTAKLAVILVRDVLAITGKVGSIFLDRKVPVELTNVCVISMGDKLLVQNRIYAGEMGVIFPGGHVEKGESLIASVKREIFEETGLTIEHPIPCGFKDWENEDGSRYIVLIFKTDRFSGELRSSKEGKVYWVSRKEFEELNVIWHMREVLEIADSEEFSEIFYPDEDDSIVMLG